jgi:hypothetical protein
LNENSKEMVNASLSKEKRGKRHGRKEGIDVGKAEEDVQPFMPLLG